MNTQLSISHLIMDASGLVQAVMALLLIASVMSWATIFAKRWRLANTRNNADRFEERFWSGGSLAELYESLKRNKEEDGIAALFRAGYEEYSRQQQLNTVAVDDAMASVQRSMRVSQVREVESLEGGLSFLATVGSTSPYVGLFGTVWGIMNAFIAIGNVKQATIAMVAPGIAEALIATAMGLFAAIPAVIGYNFFTNQVDRLETRFNTFAEELAGILERALRQARTH